MQELLTARLPFVLLIASATALQAQMAEPVHIDFAHGTSAAVVQGTLSGAQQMQYSAVGRAKQTVTLRLTQTPPETLEVSLRNPDLDPIPLRPLGGGRFSAILAKSGAFNIWITRVSKKSGPSHYTLRVAIR